MSDYLNELPLLKWFRNAARSQKNTQFPGAGNRDYWLIYEGVNDYLNNFAHNQVEAGASAAESGKGLYLTKHGQEHIKVVIMRAEILISQAESRQYSPALSPYEVFILLIAIHIHDLANRTGRSGHESRILEEAKKIPDLMKLDRFELLEIVKVASCHGGNIKGDKDKIGILLADKKFNGQIQYRPQLLAAILKLADELADDRTRADVHGLKDRSKFPKSGEIFHVYAASLYSVSVVRDSHSINLDFKIEASDATKTFTLPVEEGEKNTYLLDYLYERTLKTYRELKYCNRFMRTMPTSLHDVHVRIEIFNPDELDDLASELAMEPITYTIGDSGYPDERHGDLSCLAKNFNPSLTGAYVAQRLMPLSIPA